MTDIIVLENVEKVYKRDALEIPVLNDITLKVPQGEYLALMGPSGSGKTTLLNLIAGIDQPTRGRILVGGVDISTVSQSELAKWRSHTIGFIFQLYNLLPKASVQRNVELPMLYAGVPRKERRRRALELLERVGIPEKARSLPGTLSGGQRQRVAVARALANRPALLLADEPTGALDSKTGHEVLELFTDLHRQGNTILIVTHDLDIAALASRQVEILDGRIASSSEKVA